MRKPHFDTYRISPRKDSPQELFAQAEAFFQSMMEVAGKQVRPERIEKRLSEVRASIESTGTYWHTTEELTFGAQLAWRNSNRCIGRHYWRQLHVFDHRNSTSVADVFRALESHMEYANNHGAIRSAITIFPPRSHDVRADSVRILNHQLVRYAGFQTSDGSTLGDPDSLKLTNQMLELGWKPARRDRFTPLPWLIRIAGDVMEPYDVFASRPNLLNEVNLEHPENEEFKELGLKWYAVPFISDMALVIGGIVYPCAPFNGWYMGTEIGARNLADSDRYDCLLEVAQVFGWDTEKDRTLWRDRAIVELNRAVLHSYDRDGIQIGDHHSLARQFEKFCKSEAASRCPVTGDWSWLVPPISGSQTPTFHQKFDSTVVQHTNFFYQDHPEMTQCPFHLPSGAASKGSNAPPEFTNADRLMSPIRGSAPDQNTKKTV